MKIKPVPLLFVIGAAALTIRSLLDSSFGTGTLLYLVVPFAISIALYMLLERAQAALRLQPAG